MSASGPPTNETELLMRRPGSLRPDSFPRRWLEADERVLFETRPSLISLYWGRLALFIGFALLLLVDATYPDYRNSVSYWAFEGFLFLVPTGLIYLAWRGWGYALTNQRILVTSGLLSKTVEYARYDEVQGLTVGSGTTDELRFDLGPPGGPGRGRGAAGRPRRIVWKAVPFAPRVYEFVQDAFRLTALEGANRRDFAAFVDRDMQNRVRCDYCGALIDIDPQAKLELKCPRCGAPVRLAKP